MPDTTPPGRIPRRSDGLPSRRDTRTPWKTGLAISAVVHLIGILLYGGMTVVPGRSASPSTADDEPTLTGMQLVEVTIQEEEEEEDEGTPPTVPPPSPTPPTVETVTAADPVSATEEPAAGDAEPDPDEELVAAAERLRDFTRDPRLWAEYSSESVLSTEDRLESDLARELRVFHDSLNAAQARAESLTDWTYTDEDGERWGVSPGKLHLGSVTLPLPFTFGTRPGQRDAAERRAFEDEQIRRQAIEGLILQTWKDRIAAMRERRDRERINGGAGTGPPPPDTTGGSRRPRPGGR